MSGTVIQMQNKEPENKANTLILLPQIGNLDLVSEIQMNSEA